MRVTKMKKGLARVEILGRIVTVVMQLAVLALAVWAAWAGPLQGPLFKSDGLAQVPSTTADGQDWRFGNFKALMVPKLYHLNAANAWLSSVAAEDGALKRAAASKEAERHALAALSYSPSNGYAWTALAWAAITRGDEELAQARIALSRMWAPHSRDMAMPRVMLEMRWWPKMDLARREALLDELALARWVDGRVGAIERSPRLAALWPLAVARIRARERAVD